MLSGEQAQQGKIEVHLQGASKDQDYIISAEDQLRLARTHEQCWDGVIIFTWRTEHLCMGGE